MTETTQRTALVTGASRGLGLALTSGLVAEGWRVIATARHGTELAQATAPLGNGVIPVSGDVADPQHQAELARAVADGLDLLVNNASSLGPSPLPALGGVDLDAVHRVYEVNVHAPLALIQATLPALRSAGGMIMNISSDAAIGAWEGWGVYGSSKAALDQLTAVLAAENPDLAVYAVDPGDMRTQMHADAFPGEDISDRPLPDTVVPPLLALISQRPASGRYRAQEFVGNRQTDQQVEVA
ncbi:MAG: SDR family NAD(P)-dependent oxidoreductase [Euzebya sp.]